MAVGQFVTKQTWMLDSVEIRGVVSASGSAVGDDVGTRDDFDITPDDGYRHLVDLIPGSGGLMHCETYPLPHDHVNREEHWPLPQKDPSSVFEVRDPATGARRPLKVGDRVRVVGRWTIDHHPETCVTRQRGLLRVGCVWPELHPFRWDDLTLVAPPPPDGVEEVTLSLAAPVHEEVYLGGGKWLANEIAGVSSKIFVADDVSNYHSAVSATIGVSAPPLPAGWTAEEPLVSVVETVTVNGTGTGIDSIRTVARDSTGIRVAATVAAPTTIDLGAGVRVADVDGPARRVQVFQARYAVSWRPRLAAAPVTVTAPVGGPPADLAVLVQNIGPDPVTVTAVRLRSGDPAVFSLDPPVPPEVPPRGTRTLRGRFAPGTSGHFQAEAEVLSNDPAADPLLVAIEGFTTDASKRLRVRVEPEVIRLGRETAVTIVTEDSGNGIRVDGVAGIDNFDASGRSAPLQLTTNRSTTVSFHQEKEWDDETKRWIMGDKPAGKVTVPGYEQDTDKQIPFRFS